MNTARSIVTHLTIIILVVIWVKDFQTEKTIDIQLVWPTEESGKVFSERNG